MDDELRRFQAMIFTMELAADQAASAEEATEIILLAASYEPTTD
jgi:hypothetical protein